MKRNWIRFFRLSLKKKVLLLEALSCIIFAKLSLKFLPHKRWSKLLGPVQKPSHSPLTENLDTEHETILWAVKIAALRLPFDVVCLPKAMASKWMLGRRNISSRLTLGIKRVGSANPKKHSELHAWLMVGQDVVMGGDVADQFTPLATYGA